MSLLNSWDSPSSRAIVWARKPGQMTAGHGYWRSLPGTGSLAWEHDSVSRLFVVSAMASPVGQICLTRSGSASPVGPLWQESLVVIDGLDFCLLPTGLLLMDVMQACSDLRDHKLAGLWSWMLRSNTLCDCVVLSSTCSHVVWHYYIWQVRRVMGQHGLSNLLGQEGLAAFTLSGSPFVVRRFLAMPRMASCPPEVSFRFPFPSHVHLLLRHG